MSSSDFRYQSAPDRRSHILVRLRNVGFLSNADLAREFGVSPMTIRRDLHLLEARGHVRTVHGGASTASTVRGSVSDADGSECGRQRIAQRAAGLVGGGEAIAVDAGPTGCELVLALPPSYHGSVITHSMPVMQILSERPTAQRLVALGGEFNAHHQAYVGPATLEAINKVRARTLFLSAAAADVRGLYVHSGAQAAVERRLMNVADQVVLLAPSQAFTSSAPVLVGPLSCLNRVVTDQPLPEAVAVALSRAGVVVDIADVPA